MRGYPWGIPPLIREGDRSYLRYLKVSVQGKSPEQHNHYYRNIAKLNIKPEADLRGRKFSPTLFRNYVTLEAKRAEKRAKSGELPPNIRLYSGAKWGKR